MIEYGGLIDELNIIVFSRGEKLGKQTFGNVSVYPTNSKSRWFYVFDAIKTGKKIKKPDLITSQDAFECGLAGWRLSKYFNTKLQLQIHSDFLSPYFRKESLLNQARVFIAEFLISRACCARAVSRRIKESLKLKFKNENLRIETIPVFVDVQKIKDAEIRIDIRKKYPQFDFVILMASRFSREKNIGLAIDTMAEVVKKHPKTGLVIVGRGPEENNLKSKIKSLNLADSVVLEPWSDDLVSYYKTADLFLLTSNYEGYGMSVLEAMSSGCPVLMTDVGLAGEVLINGENGVVISPGDKKALVSAVDNLISDRSVLENFKRSFIATDFKSKKDYLSAYKKSWENCQ